MVDLMKWLPKPHSSHMITPEGRPNPEPSEIEPESWQMAEQAAGEVLRHVMPTVAADERRKEIVLYLQKLFRRTLGNEIFPFGSVPLRTYLPDGDIDLTTFSGPNCKEVPVHEVRSVLEAEQDNKDAEFEVKDVKFIDAEVKLIKCRVQDIVVDVSFNQIGGISTLCFLEQVDQILGKNHLFKRSIALIKAWCFFESRILGAYHGLISTYGLETLVLYFFNIFYASLDGPLAVLYRFLDYFSRFNWEKYGISLDGPFRLSSLPELVVEPAIVYGGGPLLTEIILQGHQNIFLVPQKIPSSKPQVLMHKFLNIVDPLRENNNLGRSICKSNYYRMVSAMQYGAQQLAGVLVLPKDQIFNKLNAFFGNTLAMHGNGGMLESLGAPSRGLPNVQTTGKRLNSDSSSKGSTSSWNPSEGGTGSRTTYRSAAAKHVVIRKAPSVSGASMASTPRTPYRKGTQVVVSAPTPPTQGEASSNSSQAGSSKSSVPAGTLQSSNQETMSSSGDRYDGALLAISNLYQRASSHSRAVDGMRRPPFPPGVLDLTGNFSLHVISLYYARWQLVFTPVMVETAMDQAFAAQVWRQKMVDVIALQNTFSYMVFNGVLPAPALPFPGSYPMHQPLVYPSGYFSQPLPRARGTGSYIPNPKYNSRTGNDHLPPRLRNAKKKAPKQNMNWWGNMGHARAPQPANVPVPTGTGSGGLAPFTTARHPIDPNVPVFRDASGFTILPEGGLQFVSAGGGVAVATETPKGSQSPEKGKAPASETPLPGTSSDAAEDEEVLQLQDDAEFPRLALKRK